ncbi:MAG TPA: hypothetical protein PLH37_01700 [bacterium]|nr:hypothetical protein [bacterium]
MSLQEQNRLANARLQKFFVLAVVVFVVVLFITSLDVIQAKIRDQKRKADLRQISLALQLYFDNYQKFPQVEDDDWSGWDLSFELGGSQQLFLSRLSQVGYIDHVPVDPLNNINYLYRYSYYPAGSFGCSKAFFLLQALNFESSEKKHGSGSCPEFNFVDLASNGYTIQVFE